MDDSIINSVSSLATASKGAYALLKKIPIIGEFFRYEELTGKIHDAVNDRFVNEYKILNDPKAQIEYINSFPEEQRDVIVGHIMAVQSGAQQCLNVVGVLKKFYDNIRSTKEEDVDDKRMEPDWWMLWLEHAKMTSNPQKQKILAQALELENRKQGSVSARFIRVLGDMSCDELVFFQDFTKYFSKDGYLYSSVADGSLLDDEFLEIPLAKKMRLQSSLTARFPIGLGEQVSYKKIKFGENECFSLSFVGYIILIWREKNDFEVNYSLALTPEGIMLKKFIGEEADINALKIISKKISEKYYCRVSIHRLLGDADQARKDPIISYMNGNEEI